MQNPVSETTVTIRGSSYELRTDMAADTINELADYVDTKMRELDPRGTLPPGKVSVLTSLTIAGELKEERDRSEEKRRDVLRRLERLHEMLDSALGES